MDTFCVTNSTTVWTTVCAHQPSLAPTLITLAAFALIIGVWYLARWALERGQR